MHQDHARVLVIAEAGVNHNGDLDLAIRLVESAVKAGADIVKFQTFRAESLATGKAGKAAYQARNDSSQETQLEMLRRLELSTAAHQVLISACQQYGITFLSTPFDHTSLRFLVDELGLSTLKFSSGDLTNGPLLLEGARRAQQIILSTGMASLGEVEEALAVLAFGYVADAQDTPSRGAFAAAYASAEGREVLRNRVRLLHCTTEYPAPAADVNLRAMQTLHHAFRLTVGYSDHTEGIAVPIAAVALGARVIEKHFTLDRRLPGPDHMASLESEDLTRMVHAIREVELAMGDGIKTPRPSEQANMSVARKSLVAAKPIHQGEPFTKDNVAVLRPGDGRSPMGYWDVLGETAAHDYMEHDYL